MDQDAKNELTSILAAYRERVLDGQAREAKVKAALEKVRPQGGPSNGQAPPSGTPTNSTSS